MAAPSLQEVFDNNRYQLKYAAVMSKNWFSQQARGLKKLGITGNRMLKDNDDLNWDRKIIPGRLYLYKYDAKHKATLPYWDQFPLVFPFSTSKDGKGFYGLNMHYLPYEYRIKILNQLITIDLSKNTDKKKLLLSWDLISNAAKLKPLQACVHMYLYNHLHSGLKQIYPKDFATAMLLPVENFIGASTTAVWKDSQRRIGY
jgi:hypothetical protein